eukprot:Nitzschia sp. Nitz4//scaffold200_size39268//10602//11345//NITZ4_007613-RA/size39268-processed-gene-0.12-mRNA-1//-1//CDS//3329541277//2096//frame0
MPPLSTSNEDSHSSWQLRNKALHDMEEQWSFHPQSSPLASGNVPDDSPASSPVPRRKTRFSEEHDCIYTLPRSEYTDEESKACWYNYVEYLSFRRDIFQTVQLIQSDFTRIDDVHFCMLGVEHRLEEASARRKQVRKQSITAVLEEQFFQVAVGDLSPCEIAQVYARHAEAATAESLHLAAWNRVDVQRYLQETDVDRFFNDDWIRALCPISGAPGNTNLWESQPSEQLDQLSGFDDSWLHDSLVTA